MSEDIGGEYISIWFTISVQKMEFKESLQLHTIKHLMVWLHDTIECYVKGFDVCCPQLIPLMHCGERLCKLHWKIINWSPHNSLKGGIPEEIWSGKSASCDHSRIFGRATFMHIRRAKKQARCKIYQRRLFGIWYRRWDGLQNLITSSPKGNQKSWCCIQWSKVAQKQLYLIRIS